jgi:hypothetical protein
MRALKAVVFGLGILCVGAFGTLVWLVLSGGMARETASPAPVPASRAAGPAWGDLALGQPPGSALVALVPSADTLALHFRAADGAERVIVVDPRTGSVLGRILPGER